MLDATFEKLIEKIIQIQYQESCNEESLLYQDWEFIFSDFNGWVVLYCATKKHNSGYWVYPMLHPGANIDNLINRLPEFSIDSYTAF